MSKYIAPIIISIIIVIYALGMAVFLFWIIPFGSILLPIVIIIFLGPITIALLIIIALILRIKEIKGGEEDVASKY